MVDTPFIGIQGIEGSYHHEAVQSLAGDAFALRTFPTFDLLVHSLSQGEIDRAVMAIENSIAGSILQNYLLVARHPVTIIAEIIHPVDHCLLALPGQTLQNLSEVHSHPMALAQCKRFFEPHPHIRLVEAEDTAGAARWVKETSQTGIGAIAGRMASTLHGLDILAESIQTITPNLTRFVVLERSMDGQAPATRGSQSAQNVSLGESPANKSAPVKSAPDKASLRFTLPHEKGSLLKALAILQEYGMNLTKIQSLPVMETPGRYAFFVDVIFDATDDFAAAVAHLKPATQEFKVLGLYTGAHHPQWS